MLNTLSLPARAQRNGEPQITAINQVYGNSNINKGARFTIDPLRPNEVKLSVNVKTKWKCTGVQVQYELSQNSGSFDGVNVKQPPGRELCWFTGDASCNNEVDFETSMPIYSDKIYKWRARLVYYFHKSIGYPNEPNRIECFERFDGTEYTEWQEFPKAPEAPLDFAFATNPVWKEASGVAGEAGTLCGVETADGRLSDATWPPDGKWFGFKTTDKPGCKNKIDLLMSVDVGKKYSVTDAAIVYALRTSKAAQCQIVLQYNVPGFENAQVERLTTRPGRTYSASKPLKSVRLSNGTAETQRFIQTELRSGNEVGALPIRITCTAGSDFVLEFDSLGATFKMLAFSRH